MDALSNANEKLETIRTKEQQTMKILKDWQIIYNKESELKVAQLYQKLSKTLSDERVREQELTEYKKELEQKGRELAEYKKKFGESVTTLTETRIKELKIKKIAKKYKNKYEELMLKQNSELNAMKVEKNKLEEQVKLYYLF